MAGRTAFVVANRLSLLRRADMILVLSNGRLVQTGTHEELVGQPGPYRDTALLQLMDTEPPSSVRFATTTAESEIAPAPRSSPQQFQSVE